MADFSALIQRIKDAVYENGVQAITGQILQDCLKDVVNTVNVAKQDGIYRITVTVDPTTGTPSGSARMDEDTYTLELSFSGLKGETGPQGPQGPKGDTGETGPAGVSSAQVSVDPTTGTPSATASVSDGVLTIHFSGLKGETGPQGIQGVQGPKGDTGDTGATGPQGPQGVQGPQGPQGAQGNTGSSVDYPYELVNNLTTDDATKGLSAAQGVVLDSKVSQLGQKVDVVVETMSVQSPNLFDKTAGTPSKYVSRNDGTINNSSSGAMASDYIEIPEGASTLYIKTTGYSGVVGWACYNSSKVFTHGDNLNLVSLQTGDAYFRFTITSGNADTEMLVVGTSLDMPEEYVPYGTITEYKFKDGIVATDKIADKAVTSDKLAPGAVVVDVVDFIEKVNHEPLNLLNPTTCQLGYIRSTDGVYRDSSVTTDRYATDFISVDSTGLLSNASNPYGASGGWAVYDKDKQYVRGSSSGLDAYTYQEGDVYIRVTIKKDGLGSSLYIVRGNSAPAYTPYFTPFVTYKLDDEISVPRFDPALSLAGSLGTKGDGDTISNQTKILASYPQYVKRQFNLTAAGKIAAFDVLDVGVGYDTQNGAFLRVDATNIKLCRYYQGDVYAVQTQAHGLTISDFISVSAFMDAGVLTARVGTRGGLYAFTFDALGTVDCYGIPFVAASNGTSLTAFSFRAAGAEFRKPIWVIGDSYVSWYAQRWPVQIWDGLDVKSFLLDGLAGGESATMLEEFKKMLAYGTPKFLLWCLGMNDSADEYSAALSELATICEEKGITLVLQTIPWPAEGTKADINAAVIASGYRYLDGYGAVSSDASGTWYTGLSDDGVHTNEAGAKVMATRFLADFPEFLQ